MASSTLKLFPNVYRHSVDVVKTYWFCSSE